MKHLFLLIAIITASLACQSQIYERQLGVRFGVTSGITGKIVKNNSVAIQGTLGFRKGGVQVYTLLEKYKPIDKKVNNSWFFYFGGGAHTGYINGYNKVRRWSNTSGYYYEEQYVSGFVIGLDAVIGVEYQIPGTPMIVFTEFKPLLELQSFKQFHANFYDFGAGLIFRFINY